MKRDYSDEELKALILNFIMRNTMSNWLGQVVKNNGKNVRKKIKELANDGYLILHKGNTTASLNPQARQQIMEYIDRYLRE
jgi:hypothetical protein